MFHSKYAVHDFKVGEKVWWSRRGSGTTPRILKGTITKVVPPWELVTIRGRNEGCRYTKSYVVVDPEGKEYWPPAECLRRPTIEE